MRHAESVGGLEGRPPRLMPAPARGHGAAAVHQDAKQPRREALGVAAPPERPVCQGERVLQRLLRVALVAEEVEGVPAEPEPVPGHEQGVGVQVALARAIHELRVRGAHL